MLISILKSILKVRNIPILLILLLAAFMRLYHISEYITFLGDEGRDVLVVYNILHGNLTLLGPTASVGGFFLGPIYYYLMAPALFLAGYSPVGPAVMVAIFGIATVWLIYFTVNKFFGYYPAIVSSLLYALSPLVIIYSRSSWNPNVVPFFALLMMLILYLSVTKKSWKLMLVSGFLFGILLQLHYLATFLGVVVFLFILISSFHQFRKFSKSSVEGIKAYLLFGAGTIIGWLPFLLFEVRHGFNNIQSIVKFVFSSGETGGNTKYFATVQDVFLRIFGRLLVSFPETKDLHLYNPITIDLWGAAAYLIGISSIILLGFLLFKANKKKDKNFYAYLLFMLWIIVCILLFGLYKKSIYDYYFGIVFPVPFIFFGALVSFLLARGKIVAVIAFIGVLGMVWLNWYFRPIKYGGNNQLNQVREISQFVLSKTDGKPYNFAVISSGGNSDYAYRYFFELANRPPTVIQFPGADPERKSITNQLLIVCESNPCEPRGYPLWEVAGFGQAEIVGHWPVSVLEVYKLKHSSKKY